MKNKNLLFILTGFISFTLMSCSTHKKDLVMLNATLEAILSEQFDYIKSVEGTVQKRNEVDSIYFQGNGIINDIIEKKDFRKKYISFSNFYGDNKFEIVESSDEELIKTMIRIIQLYSINNEIRYFYESHFQVDLIGFIPNKKNISKNKNETIELMPSYASSEMKFIPIVVINSDTLNYNGEAYLYNCHFKEAGKYLIEPEATVKKWGDIRHFKSGFVINVQ